MEPKVMQKHISRSCHSGVFAGDARDVFWIPRYYSGMLDAVSVFVGAMLVMYAAFVFYLASNFTTRVWAESTLLKPRARLTIA
jgi:hypothetical protein